MFCIQCGNKIPDDSIFCNACGSPTKPANQSTQPSIGPMQPTRVTMQFDNNGQAIPPQMNSGPQTPVPQFGVSNQFGSNPNNPQVPPTQMASHPFGSGQQMPLTQLSSNPNNPQYPPITGSNPYGDTSSNLQGQSIPYGVRSPYESTQYSSDPNSQPWQVPLPSATPAVPPPPPAGLQQWLIRTVGPNLASNPIFGVSLGGVLAAVIGTLASVIIISIAHAIAPHVTLYNGYYTGEDVVDGALGILPLHNVFRDAMQLFLVMNGVGLHLQNSSDALTYSVPLNGLLIIPAIQLTFGGYIAAGTDVKNLKQNSLLRGASIAIPYTLLLFLMTTQANGCLPSGNTTVCSTVSSSNAQLTMDTTSLLLFGVLWGALFGTLGASIKLARGQWRHMLYQYLRSNARPQIVGALTGSFVAVAIGSALSLLVVASAVAYTSYSSILFTHIPSSLANVINGDWATLTLFTIAQGPLYALNVFFFSLNAPISVTSAGSSTAHIAVSLFGTTPSISPWFRLLLAIPAICLFLGGRVSASLGRVQATPGAGAIQGALIAIPFTVLVMLLTLLSTITATDVSTSSYSGSQVVNSASVGVGAFDLFLWALLAGAVLGALGGIYQTSSLKTSVSKSLAPLAALPALLSVLGYTLFARISKQPNALQRTSTKNWLFSTVFCTLILLIGAGVVGGVLIGLDQMLTLDQNVRIRDITSVILIAIPGLLVLVTCAVALLRDPVSVGGPQSSASMPVLQPLYPTIPQPPQYQQYPQYPQPPQF